MTMNTKHNWVSVRSLSCEIKWNGIYYFWELLE